MNAMLLLLFLGATPDVNVLLAKQAKVYGKCGTMRHTVRAKGATLSVKTRLVGPVRCKGFRGWYKGFHEVVRKRDIRNITIHHGAIVSQVVLWCKRTGCVRIGKRRTNNLVFLLDHRAKPKRLRELRRAFKKALK